MNRGIFFLFWLVGSTCFAETIPVATPIEQLGKPIRPTNASIIWTAMTNDLPRALSFYHAQKSQIPPSTISNLLVIGGFSGKDRKEERGSSISYSSPDEKKSLWINTEWSFVDYTDRKADNIKMTEGVPDKTRAVELATNYLSRLGIETEQLAKRTGSTELKTYFNEGEATLFKGPGQPAYATNLHMRGVIFMRALDGVEFFGGSARGGCTVEFGHHANVSKILIAWRNLQKGKTYSVAGPEQLSKWIKEGKAVWQRDAESPPIEWSSINTITIKSVTPYYFTDSYGEVAKPQNIAFPFFELEALVSEGSTNVTVRLHCPACVESD